MGYVLAHRRIINELKLIQNNYSFHILYDSFKLNYNINNYNIRIIYSNEYPFRQPIIYINNINLIDIYKYIMENNISYINNCLYCNSNLKNWNSAITLINFNKELNETIRLIQFNTEKLLLKKIIDKFSNESMDYLYKYLIN